MVEGRSFGACTRRPTFPPGNQNPLTSFHHARTSHSSITTFRVNTCKKHRGGGGASLTRQPSSVTLSYNTPHSDVFTLSPAVSLRYPLYNKNTGGGWPVVLSPFSWRIFHRFLPRCSLATRRQPLATSPRAAVHFSFTTGAPLL
jgi:hypothetical protein